MNTTFYSNLIKNRRKDKGISQKDLAKALGISRHSYMRLESADEKINLDQLKTICRILDLTILIIPSESILSDSNNLKADKPANPSAGMPKWQRNAIAINGK